MAHHTRADIHGCVWRCCTRRGASRSRTSLHERPREGTFLLPPRASCQLAHDATSTSRAAGHALHLSRRKAEAMQAGPSPLQARIAAEHLPGLGGDSGSAFLRLYRASSGCAHPRAAARSRAVRGATHASALFPRHASAHTPPNGGVGAVGVEGTAECRRGACSARCSASPPICPRVMYRIGLEFVIGWCGAALRLLLRVAVWSALQLAPQLLSPRLQLGFGVLVRHGVPARTAPAHGASMDQRSA